MNRKFWTPERDLRAEGVQEQRGGADHAGWALPWRRAGRGQGLDKADPVRRERQDDQVSPMTGPKCGRFAAKKRTAFHQINSGVIENRTEHMNSRCVFPVRWS